MSEQPAFEELQRELDEIVERLERGDVPIDDAIDLWRRGEEVFRLASMLLAEAEGRLEELSQGAGDTTAEGL